MESIERITQDELDLLLDHHDMWWKRKKNKNGDPPKPICLENKDLSGLRFSYTRCQKSMRLKNCNLKNAIFRGCKLQLASFRGSNLTGAMFTERCLFFKTDFSNCIFKDTIFDNVKYHQNGNTFRFCLPAKTVKRIKKEGFVPEKKILIINDNSFDINDNRFLIDIKSILQEYMKYNVDIKILVLEDNKSAGGKKIADLLNLKVETCNDKCLERIALPDKVILAGDGENKEIVNLIYKVLSNKLEMRLLNSKYRYPKRSNLHNAIF